MFDKKQREKQIEWGIVTAFLLGIILALAKIKVSILILFCSGLAFVLNSKDRESAFLSLLFTLSILGIAFGLVGAMLGIPGLEPISGPGGGGGTGGWQY